MIRRLDKALGVEVVEIRAGEYYATNGDEVISTLLGSCVAVCIFDPDHAAGGMNHFMLPAPCEKRPLFASEVGRYAMFAIERLVNEVLKRGAERNSLRAKVFGGASVLNSVASAVEIAEQNVLVAFEYLRSEGIPIVSSDTGGREGRRIFFFPKTGRVLLKRVGGHDRRRVALQESEARGRLQTGDVQGNRVEWFT